MVTRPTLVLLVLFLALVGCDQGSKLAAERKLDGRAAVTVVPDVLDLRYAENHGVAFNLERVLPGWARAPLLVGGIAAALAIIAAGLARARTRLSPAGIGYALIAAGAVGNLVDRIARGHVIDFIHVHHWPIFNVADVTIVVGVGLLLLGARGSLAQGRPS